jgi:two-component system response regulator CssR
MFEIYLVEDEENLNKILKSYLEKEGWKVISFFNGESALKKSKDEPHLWILDIMLPDIDGFHLLKEIKNKNNSIPIIFISARDTQIDRVIGLDMGCDDYLTKPFLPRELVIRVKNLLEKTYGTNVQDKVYSISDYEINESKRTVSKNGEEIDLTSKEFDLLIIFAKNKQQAFSRDQILDKIWGNDYFGRDRVVDDLMRRIRKKLPDIRVETIYGYGYKIN